MSISLINQAKVTRMAKDIAAQSDKRQVKGKNRVSQEFLQGIAAEVVVSIHRRINHHDNITSSRKTLK